MNFFVMLFKFLLFHVVLELCHFCDLRGPQVTRGVDRPGCTGGP